MLLLLEGPLQASATAWTESPLSNEQAPPRKEGATAAQARRVDLEVTGREQIRLDPMESKTCCMADAAETTSPPNSIRDQ